MFIQENNVVYYEDNLMDGFVFSLNTKIVFPVSFFREHPYVPYPYWYIRLHNEIPIRVRAEISSPSAAGPCGPQPEGARSSACLANRNRSMIDHRLSRQNVKLFLREPKKK